MSNVDFFYSLFVGTDVTLFPQDDIFLRDFHSSQNTELYKIQPDFDR